MLTRLVYALLLLSCAAAMPQAETPDVDENSEVPWWEQLENRPADAPALDDPTIEPAGEDKFKEDPIIEDPVNEDPISTRRQERPPPSAPVEKPEKRFNQGRNKCEQTPGWECVPYYQCENQQIITDGSGLIDIRTGSFDDRCPARHLEVCCELVIVNPVPVDPPIVQHQCGTRNERGIHVSLSGLDSSETQFGEFPWMVAVLKFEKIGTKEINLFICGGSLLNYDLVLTAAHCVYQYGSNPNLKVRGGEWDTQLNSEIYPHIDLYVTQVVHHPEFNSGSLHYDVALMRLEKPFPSFPHISPICLPPPSLNIDHLSCFATGWGKESFDGDFQNVMKKVPLRMVNHRACEHALQTTRLGEFFQLSKTFTCAGGEKNVDTCKGDGGSPLVCTNDNDFGPTAGLYFQVGIVAWGIGCGEHGIPGVYADVSRLTHWITSNSETI